MKACSGHMWSISPCLALDEELHAHKQKFMPVLESTLQLDVSTPPQGLQQNIEWKKLSIEEAFAALIQSTTVPSIEDFIDILKKCKREKNLGLSRHVTLHICNNGLDTHEELGNYLVPLFVECDSMPDAQQIFRRLVHCNEYSWTSLMDGYIDCGDAHHAFDVLQNMREGGVHPSRFTFLSILRACASLRCVEQCHRILMEIAKGGLERDLFIGSTLVDVYAKCGALTEAQGVFDKLPARDAVAWNTLIAGYAEHGYGEEALICLEQMQQEGVFPSVVTSICSLKACGNIQFIDQGRKIHGEIVIKGIERDPYICNTLVDMYGKCGSLVEAQEVLDKLLARDVITWTALIAGYVEHGLPETAFHCLKQMQLEDVSPNCVTYVCILKACGSLEDIDMGKQIHADIAKEGFERDFLVDNSLVDMYIKCGSLVEAYEMFDDMPFRDIVSWNTLISGLSDHGFADEALNCLDKMQLMAVQPDGVTFVCILKACGSIGALDRGRELHSEIAEEGFESLPFVGNTLVDMYAKCNSLAECQEVFDELPVQDAVSWTALIAGYTENQFSKEALNCLEEMQVEGVPLNSATFVCSLKACSSLGAIDVGRELHAGVAREGFEGDPFVGNTLVYMYAKCGSWAEAQEVFDELPAQDVISWNLLMGGYVEHGLGKKAFVCFEKMRLEGVPMNALSFVWCLKACGITGALDKAEEMHLEIVKVGLEGDSLIRNTLVDTFAKCGSLAKARELFDELQVRDAVSWTALIAGYWESGLGMEALGFLEQMQQEGVCPDAVVLVCSLKVCGDLKAIDKGKAIHADITKHGFERESYVGNALVDMYAKCGFFAAAWKVFDRFLACDVLSWNAIMSGYAEHELGEEVIQCLEEMQLDGVCPNAATFHSILKACGIIRGMERGKEMHLEIAKKGLERDPFVGNSLVDMYSKCGSPVDSRKALEELLVRDVISWTSLLAGYAEHGLGDDALTCLEQMALEGVSPNVVSWNAAIFGFAEQGESEKALVLYAQMQEQGLLPDTVTYIGILKACGNTASYKTGKKFHAQMHATRVHEATTTVLVSALIDMYGKCGSMHDAQQVFDALPSRDLVRWTALMTGYARHGLSDIVFYSFQKMKDEGVLPNVVTFLSILTVCSHVGLVDEGRKYFEAMNKEYCIVPFIKHHNCMVDLLGRAGQLDEAEAILVKMPFQPDLVSWSTMLGACQKWGNVELGRQAFESAVRLDENCDAAFVSMLNIYADAQMWVDYKILEAMRINV